MTKKLFLLLILSILFITSSCIHFKSDATDVDKYWLPLDKNKTYVLYCTWANEATSAGTAVQMLNMGFKKVYALKGGWKAWLDEDYPQDTY